MKSLNILVDANDTIENLRECVVTILNKKYGLTKTTNDIKWWDAEKAYPMLTKKQVLEVINSDETMRMLEPLDESVKYLKQLIDDGHDIKIVSATDFQACNEKIRRMFEIFPFFSQEDYIISGCKERILGDVLVDDGPHNFGGNRKLKLLVNQPHNMAFDETTIGAIRVDNWAEIYRLITKYAQNN